MSSDRSWPTLATVWLTTAVLLPVLVALAVPLSAVDLAYAIRAGEQMLDRGEILRTDPFTFTAAGAPWLNQQWLAQIALAVVHDASGWPGLAILRGGLVGVAFGLLLDLDRRRGLDPRRAAILLLATFVVAAPGLALRAQLFGVVGFAAALWLLELGRHRPAVRWAIVPLALLWTNVHGSFVFAVALPLVAWLADGGVRGRASLQLPAVALAAAAVTLLNPFGPAVWSYAVGLATNPVVAGLASEWQPTSLDGPGVLFLASVVGVAVLLVRRPARRPPWPVVVWLAALAVLAVRAERAIVWWALAASATIAPLLAADPERAPAVLASRRPVHGILVGGFLFALVALLPIWRAGPNGAPGGLLVDAPVELTDALAGRLPTGTRAYVSQPWASWVEYALPEVSTFVDARFEVVPAEAWADYLAIARAAPDWEARLDRWGIDLVIVDARSEPVLAAALERSPRWQPLAVSSDGLGRAYRRVGVGASLGPWDGYGQAAGARSASRKTNQLMLTAGDAAIMATTVTWKARAGRRRSRQMRMGAPSHTAGRTARKSGSGAPRKRSMPGRLRGL